MEDEKKDEGIGELLVKMAEAHHKFTEEHGEVEVFGVGTDMKFPMEISSIKLAGFQPSRRGLDRIGSLVRIRPVDSENSKKTYLGIYLGDLPRGADIMRGSKSKALMVTGRNNPAIWVPELNKVVWGDSSWWGVVTSKEEAERLITDADIENIWYVKALKEMFKSEEKGE
jgi:hypothetical protein